MTVAVTVRNDADPASTSAKNIGVQVVQPSSGTEVGLLYILAPGTSRSFVVHKGCDLVIKEISQ